MVLCACATRAIAINGEDRPVKREYPQQPIVAAGVVIIEDGRIVLIQRDKEPSLGRWTFPGGAVELGEGVREAARREALEETGLSVEIGDVISVIDNVVRDDLGRIRYHYVILDFLARPTGGCLAPGADVKDACWAGLRDLDDLDITEKAEKLARRLLRQGI
jgi:ADP-ribose pyrophosphatase YjhB (NUDIX family)